MSSAHTQAQKATCSTCGRKTHLTFHHFIPRKVHRRAHFKKHFTKEELQMGVRVCRQCHNGIHRFYDEMTLAKEFADLPSLREDEKLQRFFAWVARQRVRKS